MRAAGQIIQREPLRDAEGVQHGGSQISGRHWIIGGEPSDFVAGPVDAAAVDTGTGDQSTVAEGMMFAAGICGGDLWTASEFTDPDDQGVIQHVAIAQIGQHGGQGLISWRNQVTFQTYEVVPVSVPEVLPVVVPVDRHEGDTVFQQATCQQDALTVDVAAIAIASVCGFLSEIESTADVGRAEQAEGFLLLLSHGCRRGFCEVELSGFYGGQQCLAVIEPTGIQSVEQVESRDCPIRSGWVSGDEHGISGST